MQVLQEILDVISHYAKPFREFLIDILNRILALFNKKSEAQQPAGSAVNPSDKPELMSKAALAKLKANPSSFTLALDLFRELEAKAELEKKAEELRKTQMSKVKPN